VCTWDSVLGLGNKSRETPFPAIPTAILFKVSMCFILPDESQIYISGLYISVFSVYA
jgi:hypothetical protein